MTQLDQGERIDFQGDLQPVLARAAYAAEYLGATREKHIKHDNGPETDYWLALGRAGLEKAGV